MPKLLNKKILEILDISDFISLDIETTGLDYQKDDIIEFAAVHYQNGKAVEHINFFIRPTKAIPQNITRITGITDADVAEARPFADVFPQIQSFIGDYPLIAHNVNFDLPFLEYHTRKSNDNFVDWNNRNKEYHYFANRKIDTVVLARLYLHFLPSSSLATLKEYFQFEVDAAHRALPDAEVTGKIFLELVKIALRTKLSDLQKILKLLEPTGEPIFDFFKKLALLQAAGKYKFPEGIDRESFAVNANYYNIIGEDETPLHKKFELEPIDEHEVAKFFDTGGELSQQFAAFEVRKPQVEMARAIARAFNNSNFLVVEAGTGTGKSMAYLVPAIKWAAINYGPAGRIIISTNTKNLQEQLFFKDIPLLHNIMGEKFKAVLLKGKGNYLCLDKWVTVMSDMQYRLNEKERIRVLPLYMWVQQTKTGDIAENNAFQVERNVALWSKFIAENNYCPGRSCKFYDKCFLMKARNNARDAHIVLVNHSLLFSDLAADKAVLSEYVNVIFDEAHNIEKTATEYLGNEISLWSFRDFYNKLYSQGKRETGILVQFKRRLQMADLKESHKKSLLNSIDRMTEQVSACWRSTQTFFRILTERLREISPAANDRYSTKHRYTREQNLFGDILPYHDELCDKLGSLLSELNNVIEYFKELPEDSFEYQRQLYQELNSQYLQADILLNNLKFLIEAEWDNYVYWYELPSRADSYDTRLYAAPLDVASILYEKLYQHLKTAIFTSATLAVNRSFDYFSKRVGIDYVEPERVEKLLLHSPFNYDEQVMLLVPSFLVDPKDPQFYQQVKQFIETLITTVPRGTLALFTSYSMLNSVYHSLKPVFQAENVPVYGQGIDGGRHAIINRFKEVEHSFLFGTDSFWEGVDVPGKSLEILLLTKLPFDVPTEPVIQAKAELIKRQGGNPFMEFTIPEAVIKFRQGFGRLIRSRSDFGAIIILDTRVIKKLYGRIFLNSLPLRTEIVTDEARFWDQLKQWFGG